MTEENRPVSYQQTLGTKTGRIKKETEKQNQKSDFDGRSLQKGEANFPE